MAKEKIPNVYSGINKLEGETKKGPKKEIDLRTTEEMAEDEERVLREYKNARITTKKDERIAGLKTAETVEDEDSNWEQFGEQEESIDNVPEYYHEQYEKLKAMAVKTGLPE